MDLNIKINILRIFYLFQFTILLIIILMNKYYQNSITWMNSFLKMIFLILIIILSIISLSPIIFFLLILFKKTYNIFFTLLKISLILTLISIILSLGMLLLYYMTHKDYHIFYRDCPYNYDLQNDDLMNNYSPEQSKLKLEEKCINRRCIKQNNLYELSFICNYNSTEDFKNVEKNLIECIFINDKNEYIIGSQTINIYYNICNSFVDFYKCIRSENPKKYSLEKNFICPLKDRLNYTIEIIIDSINFLIPIIIYTIQFFLYKKILKIIVSINIHRSVHIHADRTIDTSHKGELNKNSNSFKKEPTDVIIIDNEQKENGEILQIINKDKNKIKKNKFILKIKSELFSIKDNDNNNKIFNKNKNNCIFKNNKENKNVTSIMENNNISSGKNRSFTNSNINYFNDKIDLLNSNRMATQINDNDENNNDIECEKKLYDENSNIKCIKINN